MPGSLKVQGRPVQFRQLRAGGRANQLAEVVFLFSCSTWPMPATSIAALRLHNRSSELLTTNQGLEGSPSPRCSVHTPLAIRMPEPRRESSVLPAEYGSLAV